MGVSKTLGRFGFGVRIHCISRSRSSSRHARTRRASHPAVPQRPPGPGQHAGPVARQGARQLAPPHHGGVRRAQDALGTGVGKREELHNMQLVGGAAFLLFTIACGNYLNAFIFGTTPWDLVYATRGTETRTEEEIRKAEAS